MPQDFPCTYPGCHRTFKRQATRTQHCNTQHRQVSPDSEPDPALQFRTRFHPKLNALPCDIHGQFLPQHTRPPPLAAPDEDEDNPWNPCEDRLAFDWLHYHFAELQSSESEINKGLDLWAAAMSKAGSDATPPWSSAEEVYATIDSIQEGNAPFTTVSIKYTGPLLAEPNPPSWVFKAYELSTRNTRTVLHNQLATTDFANAFNYRPYQQFNHGGERVWSNMMSADWVWNQADGIAKDKTTWGATVVPLIGGSDKTTVSVATGHQEYHPVYMSPGNLTNVARCSHGNSILPVAFLPIPKPPKHERKHPEFQRFARQLYHACLARVFAPLQKGMTKPDIARFPDGHFRKAIYCMGPYIADYPEQVWLAGIVQGWCPKCEANPKDLDGDFDKTRRRNHERTDTIIECFDPGIVWGTYGIRSDVVPFTHGFPRADIHTLLSPDLLHQLIKGTFKDHLVTWVNEYLHIAHGEQKALRIIKDIDRRISVVPSYAGLRRFSEGRDFEQWTGDDSKALMKVYIAAIAGHVPSKMVQCMATFIDICYIFRRNVITSTALRTAETLIDKFHQLRTIFIDEGVRSSISLPRQHSLLHYPSSIPLFGSPNGLCSSMTESKHIAAVKEPWRRSNRYNALSQMLQTITRLDKVTALRRRFLREGMLTGSTAAHFSKAQGVSRHTEDSPEGYKTCTISGAVNGGELDDEDHDFRPGGVKDCLRDAGPENGPKSLSSIALAATAERNYPKNLYDLAIHIDQPDFPHQFNIFLYSLRHPNRIVLDDVDARVRFSGKIHVFHSATTRFYAPSDLCGPCGMYRQQIRCTPSWYGHPRRDTAFVVLDANLPGMQGMLVARLHLLFSFIDDDAMLTSEDSDGEVIQCALVSWFVLASDERDPVTGMWLVKPEVVRAHRPVQVIPLKSIARGAHLLPNYGTGFLPDSITYHNSLNMFQSYFINSHIDHHCHEFLSQ